MIDFIVVVLPTPLRPRSVTTSPRRTSRSTPCRMCDSPYQACSPLTDRSGSRESVSGISVPQVSLHDDRIVRAGRVIAFGEYLASLQHGYVVTQVRHYRKVVLDHD